MGSDVARRRDFLVENSALDGRRRARHLSADPRAFGCHRGRVELAAVELFDGTSRPTAALFDSTSFDVTDPEAAEALLLDMAAPRRRPRARHAAPPLAVERIHLRAVRASVEAALHRPPSRSARRRGPRRHVRPSGARAVVPTPGRATHPRTRQGASPARCGPRPKPTRTIQALELDEKGSREFRWKGWLAIDGLWKLEDPTRIDVVATEQTGAHRGRRRAVPRHRRSARARPRRHARDHRLQVGPGARARATPTTGSPRCCCTPPPSRPPRASVPAGPGCSTSGRRPSRSRSPLPRRTGGRRLGATWRSHGNRVPHRRLRAQPLVRCAAGAPMPRIAPKAKPRSDAGVELGILGDHAPALVAHSPPEQLRPRPISRAAPAPKHQRDRGQRCGATGEQQPNVDTGPVLVVAIGAVFVGWRVFVGRRRCGLVDRGPRPPSSTSTGAGSPAEGWARFRLRCGS